MAEEEGIRLVGRLEHSVFAGTWRYSNVELEFRYAHSGAWPGIYEGYFEFREERVREKFELWDSNGTLKGKGQNAYGKFELKGSIKGAEIRLDRFYVPNGYCSAVFDEDQGEIYEGGMCPKTGLRHGLGACVYVSRGNHLYEGEWRLGREHGRGVLLTRDRRAVYAGDFADGKMHGQGLYRFPNGDAYRGDFRENARHGSGRYVSSKGTYEGEWRDNARHGRGVFVDARGSRYEGDWCNDKMHGRGTLKLSNGLVYEGQFSENLFDGRGVCEYPDKQKYAGMWRAGKKDGRGSLFWPNGASYEGRFKDDQIDGQGTLCMSKPTADAAQLLIPVDLKLDMAKIHRKAGFS